MFLFESEGDDKSCVKIRQTNMRVEKRVGESKYDVHVKGNKYFIELKTKRVRRLHSFLFTV